MERRVNELKKIKLLFNLFSHIYLLYFRNVSHGGRDFPNCPPIIDRKIFYFVMFGGLVLKISFKNVCALAKLK